jgi:hypothetical protein
MPVATLDAPRRAGLAAFARGVLGHDPWSMQETILRAVAGQRRVAVKACHSSAKTFTAAEAVLWWVTRFPDGIAVTTAPTWVQVERLLWGEIKKSVASARIAYPEPLRTELHLGPGRYAMGLSTNEGVKFQGWHGRILLVLDEAPGVRPDIWEAIEGIRAGGDVHVLAIGNPTIPSGPFYECFAAGRAGWDTYTIDAFDTPNLRGWPLAHLLDAYERNDPELDAGPRPYLVSRRWVAEKWHEWGEQSPLWQSRVRGAFPDQAEDALLSLAWLEEAARCDPPTPELQAALNHEWRAGVDVAGPGEDETALCVRQGPRIELLRSWARPDPRGEVLAALAPYRDRLRTVAVDSAGLGYYFCRHLEDHGFAGKVADVNVGVAAAQPEKYANKKAEAYWALRERFAAGDVCGLADATALSQLAGIRYAHTARGQIEIERKEDARKRGVKSPDRAEAIMLAFVPVPDGWIY